MYIHLKLGDRDKLNLFVFKDANEKLELSDRNPWFRGICLGIRLAIGRDIVVNLDCQIY